MVMTVIFMITLITLRDGAEKQKRHIYVRSSGFSFRQLKLCSYLLFVTDTTDGVCVKKIARCRFLQI